jgi:hypothetical protein
MMGDENVKVWARPRFELTEQPTELFFVCFAKAPLSELPLDRARYGLPKAACVDRIVVREHHRRGSAAWYEGWWAGSFGVVAARELGDDLPLLTASDTCFTIELTLPDQPDLAPAQSVWALSRWFCERGALVVLDVHAFTFRAKDEIALMGFDGPDVARDVKVVLENEPTRDGLHLLHTRGLCKFGRPELLCFVTPNDAPVAAAAQRSVAQSMIEGQSAARVRLKLTDELELITGPLHEPALLSGLGLQRAVELRRADGAPLSDLGRIGVAR